VLEKEQNISRICVIHLKFTANTIISRECVVPDLCLQDGSCCRKYNFDGLDLHWQYPGDPEAKGVPADKENFVLLLKVWLFGETGVHKYCILTERPVTVWFCSQNT
jgi:hypothetical protein